MILDYDGRRLLNQVQEELPSTATFAKVENAIVEKARAVSDELSPLAANGSITQQSVAAGDFVDFIIVGYENQTPKVHRVRIEIDWLPRKVSSPVIESVDSNVSFYGRSQAIQNAVVPGSAEALSAAHNYPGVIKGIEAFRNQQTIGPEDCINIAVDLVRLEAEFDPGNVGPPINAVLISGDYAPVNRKFDK